MTPPRIDTVKPPQIDDDTRPVGQASKAGLLVAAPIALLSFYALAETVRREAQHSQSELTAGLLGGMVGGFLATAAAYYITKVISFRAQGIAITGRDRRSAIALSGFWVLVIGFFVLAGFAMHSR